MFGPQGSLRSVVAQLIFARDLDHESKDSAWGWNVGALFTLSPATKVGISYRSRIKYDTTGDVKWQVLAIPLETPMGFVPAGSAEDNLKASLTMPDTAILSVSQKLDSRWGECLAIFPGPGGVQ